MSQYIKKVGVTPVRGNGFIIDSFHTNDNKQFNAPSLRAVEEYFDNDVLFASWFSAVSRGGVGSDETICGWKVTNADTIAPPQFAPQAGIVLQTGNNIIKSPMYTAFDANFLNEERPTLSVSLEIYQYIYSSEEEERDPILVKIENINHPYRISDIPVYTDTLGYFTVSVSQIYGGFFSITVNVLDKGFQVRWIKLEKGANCTEFKKFSRDTGASYHVNKVYSSLKSEISSSITSFGNSFLKVGSHTETLTDVPTVGKSYSFDVSLEGYTPIGIIGVNCSADLIPREFDVNSITKRANFFIVNSTGLNGFTPQTKSGTLSFYVLYVDDSYLVT